MTINYRLKHIFQYGLIIIILIYLASSLYLTFKTDEEVTMSLMNRNFVNIIRVDSLDVHPPLYYLFLKIFLSIVTFWTNSIFVKVLFSRLFSFIFLILFLIIMFHLIKLKKIHVNVKVIILFFLLSPGVINESFKIRMYSLATFFLASELYNLVQFCHSNRKKYIAFATVMAILASYTIYPVAVSAGIFLLIYFLKFLIEHHKRRAWEMFLSGICLFISYIPWLYVVYLQFKEHSNSDGNLSPNYFYSCVSALTQINAPAPNSPLLKYICLFSLFIIIASIYIIVYYLRIIKKSFSSIFIIVLCNMLFTLILTLVFCRRQFRSTTIYPIFAIYIFLFITFVYVIVKKYRLSRIVFCLLFGIIMIFGLYSLGATFNNAEHYDKPSFQLVENFNQWKHSSSDRILIDKYLSSYEMPTSITQDSIYLNSLNKKAVISKHLINKSEVSKGTLNSRDDNLLFYKLFPNLFFK